MLFAPVCSLANRSIGIAIANIAVESNSVIGKHALGLAAGRRNMRRLRYAGLASYIVEVVDAGIVALDSNTLMELNFLPNTRASESHKFPLRTILQSRSDAFHECQTIREDFGMR